MTAAVMMPPAPTARSQSHQSPEGTPAIPDSCFQIPECGAMSGSGIMPEDAVLQES